MKTTCEICGAKFEKIVPWKKVCSPRCRQAKWALKQVKVVKKKKVVDVK